MVYARGKERRKDACATWHHCARPPLPSLRCRALRRAPPPGAAMATGDVEGQALLARLQTLLVVAVRARRGSAHGALHASLSRCDAPHAPRAFLGRPRHAAGAARGGAAAPARLHRGARRVAATQRLVLSACASVCRSAARCRRCSRLAPFAAASGRMLRRATRRGGLARAEAPLQPCGLAFADALRCSHARPRAQRNAGAAARRLRAAHGAAALRARQRRHAACRSKVRASLPLRFAHALCPGSARRALFPRSRR